MFFFARVFVPTSQKKHFAGLGNDDHVRWLTTRMKVVNGESGLDKLNEIGRVMSFFCKVLSIIIV